MQDKKCCEEESSSYNLDRYMIPIWQGNTVYNESVLPLKGKDGSITVLELAYVADRICEVRSSDLSVLYEEGRDYWLMDGKLCISPDGRIPVMTCTEYYPDIKNENAKNRTGGGGILFIEGGFFHTKQLSVTYTHSDVWGDKIPEAQADLIPKTVQKLKNKEKVRMAFFGDSIYTGCNASGTPFGGDQPPFMPSWFDMVTEKLKKIYGGEIEYVNHSRGGRKSFWVNEAPDELFEGLAADIAWIGYGMNDRETSLDEYSENIKKMMQKIRRRNPDIEFILTSPMLANKEADGYYRLQYRFIEVLNGFKGNGVAVMDVTSVHTRLLKRKAYRDMTGNNINHPNDFLCRMYAQTALQCFMEK